MAHPIVQMPKANQSKRQGFNPDLSKWVTKSQVLKPLPVPLRMWVSKESKLRHSWSSKWAVLHLLGQMFVHLENFSKALLCLQRTGAEQNGTFQGQGSLPMGEKKHTLIECLSSHQVQGTWGTVILGSIRNACFPKKALTGGPWNTSREVSEEPASESWRVWCRLHCNGWIGVALGCQAWRQEWCEQVMFSDTS